VGTPVRIYIPGPLRSYTRERAEVAVEAGSEATVGTLLDGLEAQFPGIRFRMIDEAGRIREHIRLFVDGERAGDLGVKAGKELQIICAISGGTEPSGAPRRQDGQEGTQQFGSTTDRRRIREESYGNPR
jgi:sulfur-carrier protein